MERSGPATCLTLVAFALPGFDTGRRKLRASGIIRASSVLLTSKTLTFPGRSYRLIIVPGRP